LHVIFRQTVELPEISAEAKVIAVDVNENVIMYSNNDFVERFETNEGIIRTRYFLKRRRIQSKVRKKELQAKLLEKYRGRGWRRIRETYYRVAGEIIGKAKEVGATVIMMDDLNIRKEEKGSKELNGRLHRWSYRRFQKILEYEAKLHGLNVKYVDPKNTSKMCPIYGSELDPSPNGRRLMRCWRCGLEEDRDMIAVKNLVKRYYEECMSTKPFRPPLMTSARLVWGARVPPKAPRWHEREGLARARPERLNNGCLTFNIPSPLPFSMFPLVHFIKVLSKPSP
jgi:putative transposase